MEAPGSGAEPVEDDRIQEPATRGRSKSNASPNAAPSAAVPPPPRATPLRREQAGGGGDGSRSAAAVVDRKGKGTLPPRAIPSPPSSAGSSSSFTRSVDYAAAFRAGAFGDGESSTAAGGGESSTAAGAGESSSAAGGSKARLIWSDPVAAETRGVPDAAAHPFDSNLVSRQRLVKAPAAVDKGNRRWEQQFNSLRVEEAMHRNEQTLNQSYKQWFDTMKNRGCPNEVVLKWSDNDDDEIPYPLYAEFCGDNSAFSPKREWNDVRVVRKLRGLRWQERVAARFHFRGLRDSRRAARSRPTSLFMSAMDKVGVEKAKENSGSCVIPEYLTCPLSGELMIDPVTIATGKTFERHLLKAWFEKKGHICPLTSEIVSSTIVRNDRIRGYLEEWNEVMEEE